jgi:hypothetical protein
MRFAKSNVKRITNLDEIVQYLLDYGLIVPTTDPKGSLMLLEQLLIMNSSK